MNRKCPVAGVSSFVGHSGDVHVWLGQGSVADAGAAERNSLFFMLTTITIM